MSTELAREAVAAADAVYFAAPGLSNSGMRDIAVSPYRYWHRWINPQRPLIEPTAEMLVGSALHCAVLEPDEFDKRYACEIDADDFPGCLITMEDLRQFVRDKGGAPKGTRKAEVIPQAQKCDPNVVIFDLEWDKYEVATAGKAVLKKEAFRRVAGMAVALRREPVINKILATGRAEVPLFATDPDSGVPLKGKLDWVSPDCILDLKTFSQQRGKSIDKAVADAIYYEGYSRQGYFYTYLDGLATAGNRPFVMGFVESEEPHEVRIRELRPKRAGEANLYWMKSQLEVRGLIRIYADYMRRFGTEPWRDSREIDPLVDEEMPQQAF